jgi:hypothetical protein
MNRNLRSLLLGVAAGLALPLLVACTADDGPPACNALAACCDSPNFGGGASSCLETAMSGMLSDAACGAELAMYESTGTCSDGGLPTPGDATAN